MTPRDVGSFIAGAAAMVCHGPERHRRVRRANTGLLPVGRKTRRCRVPVAGYRGGLKKEREAEYALAVEKSAEGRYT